MQLINNMHVICGKETTMIRGRCVCVWSEGYHTQLHEVSQVDRRWHRARDLLPQRPSSCTQLTCSTADTLPTPTARAHTALSCGPTATPSGSTRLQQYCCSCPEELHSSSCFSQHKLTIHSTIRDERSHGSSFVFCHKTTRPWKHNCDVCNTWEKKLKETT